MGARLAAEPRCLPPNSPALSPASTLSQLSDSGQTLSEDSGVDIGEVETSGKDKSRQPVPGKSRSLKEATRSEGVAEGACKPVRLGAQEHQGAAFRGWWTLGTAVLPTASSAPSAWGSNPSCVLWWLLYPPH